MKTLSMPFQVGWDVTHLCNFRCKHCLFTAEQLSDETWLDRNSALSFVSYLASKKVFHLSIAGGEPLLYPYIVEVVETATSQGILVALSTNASLLTDDMAIKLVKAGLRSIQISLDGPTESVNDSIRGTGRFKKTILGLRTALKHGMSVYLAIVILRPNVNHIRQFVDFAVQLGVRGVKVQTLIESGLGLANISEIEVPSEELSLVLRDLWAAKPAYSGKIELMLPLIPEVILSERRDVEYYNASSSCLGCQPGLSTVRVNSRGDVRACGGMVDAPPIGNVLDTPLQEIWLTNSELIKWRNESELSQGNSATACGSICGKGCRSPAAPAFAKAIGRTGASLDLGV